MCSKLLTLALLAIFLTIISAEKGSPEVYKGVENGCDLIKCPEGTFCGIFKGTSKFGERPFETFLFPKCVKSEAELATPSAGPDGNSHVETNGPGCDMVQCSQGYQCQVRVSVSKLGDLPYAQSINGFPQCLNATQTYQGSSAVTVGGFGCDKLATPCAGGTQCMVASGIAKYGDLPWSQFFWPFCA